MFRNDRRFRVGEVYLSPAGLVIAKTDASDYFTRLLLALGFWLLRQRISIHPRPIVETRWTRLSRIMLDNEIRKLVDPPASE
jgi:hypothetical protein